MTALTQHQVKLRRPSPALAALAWWCVAVLGGATGGLLPEPLAAAIASAIAVGLLQALILRGGLGYSSAWFGASAIAGGLGFAAAVVGNLAFAEIAGGDRALLRQGLAAWLGLAGAGGLLLAAAQAPLTGQRNLAWSWCILGLIAGSVFWPAGLVFGHRLGMELLSRLTGALPHLEDTRVPITQTVAFATAWLLYALPFGMMLATATGGRR